MNADASGIKCGCPLVVEAWQLVLGMGALCRHAHGLLGISLIYLALTLENPALRIGNVE